MKKMFTKPAKRMLTALLVTVLLLSNCMVAFGDSTDPNEVSTNDLTVTVGSAVGDEITVSAGNTLVTPVKTSPETVKVGIGCGGCSGGCNETCSDKWGFCQCSGNEFVTPVVSIVTQSNPDIATAVINNGQLHVTGVADGKTTVVLKASFSSKDSAGIIQGTRVTKPITLTINVSDAPGKQKLASPANLSLTGSVLSWAAVPNAVQYTIKAVDKYTSSNWTTQAVTGTSLDLLSFSSVLRGGDYAFSVVAEPEPTSLLYGQSDAALKDYTLPPVPFAAPTGVEYNPVNKRITWNAVADATGFSYTVVLIPVNGGSPISAFSTTSQSGYLSSVNSSVPPGEYKIAVKALGKEAQTIWKGFDPVTYEDIYEYIPAQYTDSPLSQTAATTYTKELGVVAYSGTVDGKTIVLTTNYLMDDTKFDPATSGVELKVSGTNNPLVFIKLIGTDKTNIALTFRDAIEKPSDDISLILHEGSLQGVGGFSFKDVDVGKSVYNFSPSKLAPGYVGVVAGKQNNGYTGDGGLAVNAQFSKTINAMDFDGAGNIYIADNENYVIRKIDASTSVITTIAGNKKAASGFTTVVNGVTKAVDVSVSPEQLAADAAGNVYFTSKATNQNLVFKIDSATGTLSVVAGSGPSVQYVNGIPENNGDGGLATAAKLHNPTGIDLDSHGNIYIAEWSGNRIRKIDAATGIITTIAGNGTSWKSVSGTAAEVNAQNGAGIAPATGANMRPDHIQIVNDVIYFADYSSSSYQVRKIDLTVASPSDLKVDSVAGAPKGSTDVTAFPTSFPADGIDPSSVVFGNYSTSVTADSSGNVYFVNYTASNNYSIFMVSAANGKLYKIAGGGSGNFYSYTTVAALSVKMIPMDIKFYNGNVYYTQGNSSSIPGIYMMNPIDPTKAKTALATPQNLKVTGNVLSWNKVDNAMFYDVAITPKSGGATQTQRVIKQTLLDFSALPNKLPIGLYDITVTAIPNTGSQVHLNSAVSTVITYSAASYKASHVVIAEIFGGGGSVGAAYKNDFIKLYNPTDSPVDMTGWSVQSYNADTSVSLGAVNLTGTIMPHSYYLIKGAPSGSEGAELPTADITALSVDVMPLVTRVALVDRPQGMQGVNDPHLVDLVAVSGNIYEGTGAAAKPTMLQSIVRKDNVGIDASLAGAVGNGWNTGSNSNDFLVSNTPFPQNSSSIEPELIEAISGTVALSSYLTGTNITAIPSYTFTDGSYSSASIKQINYYWYAGGTLVKSAVNDAVIPAQLLKAGVSLKASVQFVYTNGMINQLISSSSVTITNPPPVQDAPKLIGYTASTDHGGTVKNGLDDQWINLTVNFDKEVAISNASAVIDELQFMLNGSASLVFGNTPNTSASADYPGYVEAVLSGDKKSIQFKVHFGFAIYAGYLTVKAPYGISTITDATTGKSVQWTDIALYVPNGVKLETVSQTPGNPDSGIQASVSKKVVAPASSTRGMVHILFLKNGIPVGDLNSYGANVTVHYHNYLVLNSTTFAAMFPSGLAKFSDYTATVSGDVVTITAKNSAKGDVLDLRIYAYPNDKQQQTDDSALLQKINHAESLIETDYTTESFAALTAQLAIAKSVYASSYYPQLDVDLAAQALSTSLDALVEKYDEPIPSNPGSSSSENPSSSQPESSSSSSQPDSSSSAPSSSDTNSSSSSGSSDSDSSAPSGTSSDSGNPKTGDSLPFGGLYFILIAGAMGAVVALKPKKTKKEG